jgi:osmotically-inducible protein OsmY
MTQSTVDPGQQVTDALLDDPRTTDATIDVTNDRGIITLTGTVDSIEIRKAAEEVARRQEGVVTVINDLKVE